LLLSVDRVLRPLSLLESKIKAQKFALAVAKPTLSLENQNLEGAVSSTLPAEE
jgi:hypothetical protein